ncbi:YbjN domain-containing protein [Micromonospora sp. NBC_01813]|uniref:YbjN domain-containing protein n=1 Tax=Micromonospora sp. NBC_01813 TaxID=2975988 RepID=UPI002DD99EF4|nr:YbjN domain-containing protein [Micromonospora sp. NBC_01813]WSA11672.1 YbjN domain-containing protein [Micromonospora sp. NBC_01813]
MTADELIQALDEATDLPDGDGKITELERIAAHADAAGHVRIGFDARMALIDTYNNHTERWRMLPSFGWCLNTFDRHPELFEPWDAELLRWYHKWAVATLRSTPRVGLAQTEAALDDMQRRFTASGQSLQAVYNLRCKIADHVGDETQARQWLDRWRTAERDENSDCAGCDPSRQADLLAGWGDWAEALAVAEPVLSGALGCTEQPEKALVVVIMPYLRLGRYAEAAQAHVRAYRRHRHERDAFPYLAEHLRFCALTNNHERALEILAEHLEWFDRPYDDASAMEFAAAAALVCRLATAAGLGERVVHRPEHGDRPAADPTVEALGVELAAAAGDLAARFDARNGTDHQSRRIAGWLAAEPLVDSVELPAEQPVGNALAVGGPPPGGVSDVVAPLTLEGITAALNERGDRYFVDESGVVGGKWGRAVIHFERLGEEHEILHVRMMADRRLPVDRLAEAYHFCNAWNHDRLLPKVYVHDTGNGELILAGDVSTDLEYGVSGAQIAVLVSAAIATGVSFADAVAELP